MRILLLFVLSVFCSPAAWAQDAPAPPEYAGTYAGKAPCADCKIIEAELELHYGTDTSGEFALREKYVRESCVSMVSRRKGDWVRVFEPKLGTLIVLDNDVPDKTSYYLFKKDGSLLPLDKELNKLGDGVERTLVKK